MTGQSWQRPCEQCTRPITVTSRNPNRRFCSARCRRTAHYYNQTQHPTTSTDAIATPNVVPNAVRAIDAVPDGVPAVNGVQRCPHCRGELAVLAVLIPAEAAHVRLPEVGPLDP
jgi:hypothetical protein